MDIRSNTNTNADFYNGFTMQGKNLEKDSVNKQRHSLHGGIKGTTADQAGEIGGNSVEVYLSSSKKSAELGQDISNKHTEIKRYKRSNPLWDMDPTGSAQAHAEKLGAQMQKLTDEKKSHDKVIDMHLKSAESQLETQAKATASNVIAGQYNSVTTNGLVSLPPTQRTSQPSW